MFNNVKSRLVIFLILFGVFIILVSRNGTCASKSPQLCNGVCTFKAESFSNIFKLSGYVALNFTMINSNNRPSHRTNYTLLLPKEEAVTLNATVFISYVLSPVCQVAYHSILPEDLTESIDFIQRDNLTDFIATNLKHARAVEGYVAIVAQICNDFTVPNDTMGATTNFSMLNKLLSVHGIGPVNMQDLLSFIDLLQETCLSWIFFLDPLNPENSTTYLTINIFGPEQHSYAFSTGGESKTCSPGYQVTDQCTCQDVDECVNGDHNCSQVCINSDGSYNCGCLAGYQLIADKRTCSDINECSISNGDCSFKCINDVPGYHCECDAGYILADNGRTCGVSLIVSGHWPDFGPVDGGTRVTMTGSFTGVSQVISVYLEIIGNNTGNDSFIATVTKWTPTSVSFTTPAVSEVYADRQFIVFMTYNTTQGMTYTLDTALQYTYKGNPTITGVFPRSTIFGGGISLTAVGSNLDSVASPDMVMYVEKRDYDFKTNTVKVLETDTYLFDNTTVFNGSIMTGVTPAISLPTVEANASGRRKRATEGNSTARNTTTKPVNSPELQLFIGFNLDGVKTYNNLSEALGPEAGKLSLYRNTEVIQFKVVLKFDPSKQRHIDIQGRGFIPAITYVVTIGTANCVVIKVSDNVLQCEPPNDKPEPSPEDTDGQLFVKVHIGIYLTFIVGRIDYVSNNDVIIYSSAAVAGTVLLAVLLIILLVYRLIHNNGDEKKSVMFESSRNPVYLARDYLSHRDIRRYSHRSSRDINSLLRLQRPRSSTFY